MDKIDKMNQLAHELQMPIGYDTTVNNAIGVKLKFEVVKAVIPSLIQSETHVTEQEVVEIAFRIAALVVNRLNKTI